MSRFFLSRRSFLKKSVVSAAAAGAVSTSFNEVFAASGTEVTPGPGNKWPGRVAVNFNKEAVTFNGALPVAQPEVIGKMVDDSVKLLTGESDIGAAWKAVFPSTLTEKSKIAIKVPLGFVVANMAPHWASVKAITAGLQMMDFSGTKFPAENISIYDMHGSNMFGKANVGYTTDNFGTKIKMVRDSVGSGATDGPNKLQYAKTLANADFLINVFRAGGHSDWGEGFTLGFKNHYGTFPSPSSFHDKPVENLRDLNCTGVVLKKNVLSVCSGIFGAKEKSGVPTSPAIGYLKYAKTVDSTISADGFPSCTIIMSTDPVSAEMQAIKMMRLNNGGAYGVNDMPKYLKASAGVSGAANPLYNIGIIDESKMDIRKIVNGEILKTGVENRQRIGNFSGNYLHAKQLKGSKTSFIEFNLSHEHVGKKASIEIYSTDGVLIYESALVITGFNGSFSWNETDTRGKRVGGGVYLIRVKAGSTRLSSRISIAR